MNALVFAYMLAMPLYPVNPVQQDTVNFMNMHFTAAVTGPNTVLSTGVELSTKYELMLIHPIVLRGAIDYKFGSVSDAQYPDGYLYGPTLSVEALYYRGTTKMTGFVGGGLVFSHYDMSLSSAAADSLLKYEDVTDVGFKSTMGYRFTAGLRFRSVISLEVNLTDLRPDFIKTQSLGPSVYAEKHRQTRFNDIRLSIGFLLPIKRFY